MRSSLNVTVSKNVVRVCILCGCSRVWKMSCVLYRALGGRCVECTARRYHIYEMFRIDNRCFHTHESLLLLNKIVEHQSEHFYTRQFTFGLHCSSIVFSKTIWSPLQTGHWTVPEHKHIYFCITADNSFNCIWSYRSVATHRFRASVWVDYNLHSAPMTTPHSICSHLSFEWSWPRNMLATDNSKCKQYTFRCNLEETIPLALEFGNTK